jgi:hypothetical protein
LPLAPGNRAKSAGNQFEPVITAITQHEPC